MKHKSRHKPLKGAPRDRVHSDDATEDVSDDATEDVMFKGAPRDGPHSDDASDDVMTKGAPRDGPHSGDATEDVMIKSAPRDGPHSDDATEDFTIKESFQELTPPSKDRSKPWWGKRTNDDENCFLHS